MPLSKLNSEEMSERVLTRSQRRRMSQMSNDGEVAPSPPSTPKSTRPRSNLVDKLPTPRRLTRARSVEVEDVSVTKDNQRLESSTSRRRTRSTSVEVPQETRIAQIATRSSSLRRLTVNLTDIIEKPNLESPEEPLNQPEFPEEPSKQPESPKKTENQLESPKKALRLSESPEKPLKQLESPKKALKLSESPKKQLESPEKPLKQLESPEKALKLSESPEKLLKQPESPENSLKLSVSPEKPVKQLESPEKLLKLSESPEKSLKQLESPEKPLRLPESPKKQPESPEKLVKEPAELQSPSKNKSPTKPTEASRTRKLSSIKETDVEIKESVDSPTNSTPDEDDTDKTFWSEQTTVDKKSDETKPDQENTLPLETTVAFNIEAKENVSPRKNLSQVIGESENLSPLKSPCKKMIISNNELEIEKENVSPKKNLRQEILEKNEKIGSPVLHNRSSIVEAAKENVSPIKILSVEVIESPGKDNTAVDSHEELENSTQTSSIISENGIDTKWYDNLKTSSSSSEGSQVDHVNGEDKDLVENDQEKDVEPMNTDATVSSSKDDLLDDEAELEIDSDATISSDELSGFVESEAMECSGSETPSDGSNDITEVGISLDDSSEKSSSDEYESDSFIVDDDQEDALLSGTGDDLSDRKSSDDSFVLTQSKKSKKLFNKKMREKSRIIHMSSSSEDDTPQEIITVNKKNLLKENKKIKNKSPKQKTDEIPEHSSDEETEIVMKKSPKQPKVNTALNSSTSSKTSLNLTDGDNWVIKFSSPENTPTNGKKKRKSSLVNPTTEKIESKKTKVSTAKNKRDSVTEESNVCNETNKISESENIETPTKVNKKKKKKNKKNVENKKMNQSLKIDFDESDMSDDTAATKIDLNKIKVFQYPPKESDSTKDVSTLKKEKQKAKKLKKLQKKKLKQGLIIDEAPKVTVIEKSKKIKRRLSETNSEANSDDFVKSKKIKNNFETSSPIGNQVWVAKIKAQEKVKFYPPSTLAPLPSSVIKVLSTKPTTSTTSSTPSKSPTKKKSRRSKKKSKQKVATSNGEFHVECLNEDSAPSTKGATPFNNPKQNLLFGDRIQRVNSQKLILARQKKKFLNN